MTADRLSERETERSSEVVDLGLCGLKLLQDRRFFGFSEDAVRLAEFAADRVPNAERVCELGSGSGGLSLLMWARLQTEVVGVEVMPANVELARRTLALNGEVGGLREQVSFVCADWRDWADYFSPNDFDLLVSNPPFWKQNEGRHSPVAERCAATHEMFGSLSDMLAAARGLLSVGGALCFVLPSSRDKEAAALLQECGFLEREREYFAQRVMFWAEKS